MSHFSAARRLVDLRVGEQRRLGKVGQNDGKQNHFFLGHGKAGVFVRLVFAKERCPKVLQRRPWLIFGPCRGDGPSKALGAFMGGSSSRMTHFSAARRRADKALFVVVAATRPF
jgi:hypothetical protein